jgi:hypothetical protein
MIYNAAAFSADGLFILNARYTIFPGRGRIIKKAEKPNEKGVFLL